MIYQVTIKFNDNTNHKFINTEHLFLYTGLESNTYWVREETKTNRVLHRFPLESIKQIIELIQ